MPPPPPDFDSIWSPAKVFSPTASKLTSQSAKDWSYIDTFLSTLFTPNPVPSFERNPATLKALLSLAAHVESANDQHVLSRRVKELALEALRARDASLATVTGEPLLSAVEDSLTDAGRQCLNSTALLSVALASESSDPQVLASHLIDLSVQEAAVARQTLRIEALHRRLEKDLAKLRAEEGVGEKELALPANIPQRITEWKRNSRHLKNKAEDYRERLGDERTHVTVPDVVKQEAEVAALKERVLELEAQVKGYQGLPADKDLARLEVERVQAELEELERVREGLYDGMLGK